MDLANRFGRESEGCGHRHRHVGLPLSIKIARAGFPTGHASTRPSGRGQETQELHRRRQRLGLSRGRRQVQRHDRLGVLATCEYHHICVPTPFTASKDPDVSFIEYAGREVAKYLKPGRLSSSAPRPIPRPPKRSCSRFSTPTGQEGRDKDYFLSFVPERIDPGTTNQHPHHAGRGCGVTRTCTDLTVQFYARSWTRSYRSARPAPRKCPSCSKNIFRSVNIALVNEMAMMCDRMGNLDIWEVINAASSKPSGFMPSIPGPASAATVS